MDSKGVRPSLPEGGERSREGAALVARAISGSAVADPVDRSGRVVADEQRAVGERKDIGGTAPRALALQEAGEERLWRSGASLRVDRHAHDLVADLAAAVPRAVLGNEDVAAIRRRKLGAAVEAHAERGDVRAELGDRCRELAARATRAE